MNHDEHSSIDGKKGRLLVLKGKLLIFAQTSRLLFFLLSVKLNIYFLFKCFQKSKFPLSKDSLIFLVVGKYQSRAPKAYLSIYLSVLGPSYLWINGALTFKCTSRKNIHQNMNKNWSFAKITDILLNN